MIDLEAYLAAQRERIDRAIEACLPAATVRPAVLHRAMRYSLFPGGKRLRPVLCLAAAQAVAADGGRRCGAGAMAAAVALEVRHTYMLIHDDLPCMDDDAERRGRPTVHVAFGEANAVLAGDARRMAHDHLEQAVAALDILPEERRDPLRALALQLADRTT